MKKLFFICSLISLPLFAMEDSISEENSADETTQENIALERLHNLKEAISAYISELRTKALGNEHARFKRLTALLNQYQGAMAVTSHNASTARHNLSKQQVRILGLFRDYIEQFLSGLTKLYTDYIVNLPSMNEKQQQETVALVTNYRKIFIALKEVLPNQAFPAEMSAAEELFDKIQLVINGLH
jgi:hypothetical protein